MANDPFANMNPVFVARLQAMMNASGGMIGPGSGYRSFGEQAKLYQDYINGVPGQARAAKPGKSKHNHGFAMDVTGPDGRTLRRDRHPEAFAWLKANAHLYGLHIPMDDEDWHVEMTDGPSEFDGGGGEFANGAGPNPSGFGIQYNLNYTDGTPAVSPEEVRANRLHAIMKIIGNDTELMTPMVNSVDEPMGDVTEDADDTSPYLPWMEGGPRVDVPMDVMGSVLNSAIQNVGGAGRGGGQGGGGLPPAGGVAGRQGGGANYSGGSKGDLQRYAAQILPQYGMDPNEIGALITLWNKESGWRPTAQNPTSTAYGIAQFLNGTWAGTGFQKTSDGRQQIQAGLTYIKQRYGTPSRALQFHLQNNWY